MDIKDQPIIENNEARTSCEEGRNDCIGIAKKATYTLFFLFTCFLVVIAFVVNLQFFGAGVELRKEAEGNNFEMRSIPAKRGDILAVNGDIISSSVDRYKIYMDLRPKQLKEPLFSDSLPKLASSLSKLFKDASPAEYKRRLKSWRSKGRGHQLISPPGVLLDYNDLMLVKTFPLLAGVNRSKKNGKNWAKYPTYAGISSERSYVRINYYDNLARRMIGRIETPNAKGYGLELSFDKYLRGKDGKRLNRKISSGFWMPIYDDKDVLPEDGSDVLTTLDANIQDVAETSLYNMIDKNKAISGTAIVMDVKSGEIRAMVNLGRNKKNQIIENFNHAIASSVEPGSTYKLIPLMILLDNTDMTINTIVDTEKGKVNVNGKVVTDTEKGGLGKISMKTAMSKSSNVAFALSVDRYFRDSAKYFISKIHEIGITKSFNFQIVGERKPFIKDASAKSWHKLDLVTMSYGYASQFTALRMLMLYNAVANDGKLIEPLLVKGIQKDGVIKEEYEAKVLNDKICKSSTLKQVKIALEDVGFDGTVRRLFRNEGYVVAGKTGTAHQLGPDGRYISDKGSYYLASFVGYFPADNPQYSCIVQVQTFIPRGVYRNYFGTALAAPVFKDISHYISSFSDWGSGAGEYAEEKKVELAKSIEKHSQLNNLKTKNRYSDLLNKEAIDYRKIPIKVIGDKEEVDFIKDEFDIEDFAFKSLEPIVSNPNVLIMPNVIGYGLSDVIFKLERMGLIVSATGKGRVVRQSIPKGRRIKKGNKVTIKLRP